MELTGKIRTYGESTNPQVVIKSHWSYNDMVQIEIDEEEVTVLGDDLILAIKNCMNV